jgi:hypothetical protein
MQRFALIATTAFGLALASPVGAQTPEDDALVASNVCQLINNQIVHAPGGKISATVGDYKIDGANGSIVISKGDRPIISGFTFDAYVVVSIRYQRILQTVERRRS